MRTAKITTFAGLAAAVGLIAGCSSATPASVSSHAAQAPKASHTAAPPPLPAGQQHFVAAVRAALAAKGDSNTVSDAALARIGLDVCSARKAGNSQADMITASRSVRGNFDMSPEHFVRTAEKDLCPGQLPPAPTVLHFNGHGNYQSPDFTVSQDMTVSYSYSGNSTGFGGDNFVADIQNSGDDVSLANDIAVSGGNSTAVHPDTSFGGSDQYYLSVQADSNASWSFTIVINH